MTKNDGGHAFPSTIDMGNGSYGYELGMTLRDWFAGQASDSDVCKFREIYIHNCTESRRFLFWKWDVKVFGGYRFKHTREQARYRYADAMLEARK